jgi:hypothetical protein
MTDAELALRHVLEAVRGDLAPEDLRRVASEWTTPVKMVIKVLEVNPAVGSVCSSRLGVCLVPGVQLRVGETLNAELLRVPPGLAWTYWAESYERLEEGWTLETSKHRGAKDAPKEQKEAPTSSLLQRNERSGRRRNGKANQRAA